MKVPSEKELFLANATRKLPQQHYLASPYTTNSPSTSADYAEAARQAGENLRKKGYTVYCPLLAGSHPIPYGWYHYDLGHLRDCKAGLLILTLPRWEKSYGIQMEIAAAIALERPVTMLSPEGLVDPELINRIRTCLKTPEHIEVSEYGVAFVMSKDQLPITTEAVSKTFAAGKSITEVADELNMEQQSVCNAIRYQLG